MKVVWIIAGVLLLLVGTAWGEESDAMPWAVEQVSTQEMYLRWAKHSPEEIIAHAQKAVRYIQENGPSIFGEFNDPNSDQWWPGRPFFSPVMVMRCDELRLATHPIPKFYPTMIQPGFIKKFTDTRGEHTFFYLCAKLASQSKGAWTKQLHFWPGTQEPVWMAVLGLNIPGTPYQVHAFYITPQPDLEKLNQRLYQKK